MYTLRALLSWVFLLLLHGKYRDAATLASSSSSSTDCPSATLNKSCDTSDDCGSLYMDCRSHQCYCEKYYVYVPSEGQALCLGSEDFHEPCVCQIQCSETMWGMAACKQTDDGSYSCQCKDGYYEKDLESGNGCYDLSEHRWDIVAYTFGGLVAFLFVVCGVAYGFIRCKNMNGTHVSA